MGGNICALGFPGVQDQVRADLRDDDIKLEGRTVRGQIIRPLVAFAFPGRDVPLPYFRRVKPETIDRIKEAELMYKVQYIGGDVREASARHRLGIPKPKVNWRFNTDDARIRPKKLYPSFKV